MHFRIFGAAAPLAAAIALAPPATAFELTRAETEAEVLQDAAGDRYVRLGFRADLLSAVPPEPVFPPEPILQDDVAVGWGEVGGIDPEPFIVLIPAGCFVDRGGFRVEDFAGCGVEVSFDDAAGTAFPALVEFAARIQQRGNGTARMDMEMVFAEPTGRATPPIPAIMAALGGTPAGVAVTTDTGVMGAAAPVLKTEALSGIEPQPFFPPDPI